jgi:tetratricopeptide (TPR) repeat protein
MTDLGDLYFKTDRIAEALDITAETLELLDRSGRGGTMTRVISALNYAAVLGRAGEVVEAEQAQRQALAIARGFDGTRALPPGFAGHLGASLSRLARYDEALRLFTEDMQAARASANTRFEALSEMMLGSVLVKVGRAGEASEHLDRAERALGADPASNARLLNELALARAALLLRSARPREAAAIVDRVLAALEYPSRRTAPGIGGALNVAAEVALAIDDPAKAADYATDSLTAATATARDPSRSANVGQARLLRAKARHRQGLDGPAREDAEAAVAALAAGLGSDHPEAGEAREFLASLDGS